MKKIIVLLACMLALTSCKGQQKQEEKKQADSPAKGAGKFAVNKSDDEWRALLSPEQYEVLRNKATEQPFTGEYDEFFEKGTYVCAACGNPLFKSNNKYNSHCGWPSFDQAIKGSVIYKHDSTYGMQRTEVMCARCGGHLGHVFDDGPVKTTGQRYCTNSVSIKFIPENE